MLLRHIEMIREAKVRKDRLRLHFHLPMFGPSSSVTDLVTIFGVGRPPLVVWKRRLEQPQQNELYAAE